MDITSHCNLRCVHCYIPRPQQGQELNYHEICGIIDQIVDEGCLWFLITGGEPLVRPDFLDIYAYAKNKGLLITLFTNGTLIDSRIADYLAEFPPFKVEITLYGMTPETYERVTGVPGSFKRCLRGIELLKEHGVPLALKTMVMTINKHELYQMKDYAEQMELGFRADPLIMKRLDSSDGPDEVRLSCEEVVALDTGDEIHVNEWHRLWNRIKGPYNTERLFTCGAGLNGFHINSTGGLQVCNMVNEPGYSLRKGTFREGYELFPKILNQKRTRYSPCSECKIRSLCNQCPAWGITEHGDAEKEAVYLCQIAHLRAEALSLVSTEIDKEPEPAHSAGGNTMELGDSGQAS
jgi:radical SAM protein with 4Fe4S-binding SPASM domain